MHPEDALIVITLPAGAHAVFTGQQRGKHVHVWEALDELLRANLLGQVTGYTTGEGHHEIQALVDRVSWEAAWDAIRITLARHGLLGAATVRLHITNEQPDDQSQETLWPPP